MGASNSRDAQEFFRAHDLLGESALSKKQVAAAAKELAALFPDR
jgi:hypothetical protein